MTARTTALTQPGWLMVAATAVLVVMGLATIYVADTAYAARADGPLNALRQAAFLAAGVAIAWLVLRVGYLRLGHYAYALFLLAVLCLVPLLIARLLHNDFGGLTRPRGGAYRWLRLPGFQLQPSELLKVVYILALAWYLRYRRSYRRFRGLLVPFAASIPPLALVLVQPDLGTALLLAAVLGGMMFLAGARVKHLLVLLLLGLLLTPVAWLKVRDYQKARVSAVLLQSDRLRQSVIDHPERYGWLATRRQALEWTAGSGYQLLASLRAIGSGELVGCGWGEGVYVERQAFLPDRHNDFIFALIAHQWGFVGCLLVLACYAVIVLAGVRIALGTTEPFGRLLAVGVVVLIAAQVVINVGMAVGLLPITGMTLPFISYGGSSLLTNMVALALLISISQHRPFLLANKPFELRAADLPRPRPAERVTAPAPAAACRTPAVTAPRPPGGPTRGAT
ncbi:MAG TPA: FtsW/RodA/SpoVE family cell cycle protein [Phycisphaerae bacterium]|nr:FtsW/RodA/SpoVE family cell cycle protein [Phycisphaerae bacterium]HNU44975.1 FtsW/RodA/SpoVE family cell cycle protein [Phycisphaerae bacterium]